MIEHRPLRLLTISHSYCVDVNRRLADELAGTGEWEVTAAGPGVFRGDFRTHRLTPWEGERCRALPISAYLTRRPHLMAYSRELRVLLEENWDLVHCWEEPYVVAAAQIASRVRDGVPLVIATFQNISKRYPPPFSWIERYSLQRADGVIAFGRTALEVLEERGMGPARRCVITPGVDTGLFRPDRVGGMALRSSLGFDAETPVVGFLGRFVPENGLRVLTAALEQIPGSWQALFIGGGPLEEVLGRWAIARGRRVVLATDVAHHDVPHWLNALDLLCAPSQTTPRWREQFGRMLIEAFACGVPVVASDSGEIPHVVADAALVVPEGRVDRWQAAIAGLLVDPECRRLLGERGRRRAVAEFDWSVVARRHSDFFHAVMGDVARLRGRAA